MDQKIKSGENIILTKQAKDQLKNKVEEKFNELLFEILPFNKNDDNFTKTPHRLAKMWVYEVFKGCFEEKPKCTSFHNDSKLDQIVTIGPMTMRSMCAHHFMPFTGNVYFAYRINNNLIGASKPERLLDWVARRPNTQENLINTFLNEMSKILGHDDVMAVATNVKHNCMTHRGVEAHNTRMHNVEIRGIFKLLPSAKEEVMDVIKMSEIGGQ